MTADVITIAPCSMWSVLAFPCCDLCLIIVSDVRDSMS